jgi:gliding motility-associated-like protein
MKNEKMKLKLILVSTFTWFSILGFGQHVPPTDNTEEPEEQAESNVLLFAPNAFTPDGDFFNDTWKIHIDGIDIYDFHCTVFNRAGQIVWESYDPSGEWDGFYGGTAAADGIYVYQIITKDAVSDKKLKFEGFITILR